MSDPATDALVARRFPAEWAKANNPKVRNRSKARQQLRQRYRMSVEREEWRLRNPEACCGACRHCGRYPTRPDQLTCDLDSDFEGYALTSAADWCIRFRAKGDSQ